MCLGKITWQAETHIGYKLFMRKYYGDNEKIINYFAPTVGYDDEYKINRWSMAKDKPHAFRDYPIGFHIIPDIDNFMTFFQLQAEYSDTIICEVAYKGVVAKGIDHSSQIAFDSGVECVVATWMKVLKIITYKELLDISKLQNKDG